VINLFPDQLDLIEKATAEFRAGQKYVLMQGCTGSGKSVMAAEIVNRAMSKGTDAWFVVPRRDLLRQMAGTFRKFDIDYSYIAAGKTHDRSRNLQICSAGTLTRRLDAVKFPKLVVVDETHFGGDELDRIITAAKASGSYLLGLSATPWKLSGKGLGCWYDTMVVGPSIDWLIKNKRLSEYRCFAPQSPDLSMLKTVAGDYAKGQLSERMEQDRVLIGNAVKHYAKHAMGKLGVTFAVSRKHSEMLAQEYRDAGIPAVHMDGDTPEDERIRIAKAFAKRELLQLCNAELLTFGYDLSSASGVDDVCIEVMVDCQPTKSLSKQWQKNGRTLRYDGTTHVIFDHANNIREHNLPSSEIEWSLADRVKKKKDQKEKTLSVKNCPVCWFSHWPSPMCPNCSHVYAVESAVLDVIDEELVELQVASKKREARMEVGKARTIADLQRIAEERGYAKGWVFQMAKVKGIRG